MSGTQQHIIRLQSPIGRIEVLGDGNAITALAIEHESALPHDDLPEVSDAVLDSAALQLGEYFTGARTEFDLPLSTRGTEFQEAVWAKLRDLDCGQHTSYGEIAAEIGKPGSSRAIGGAVGANPIPLIIGCHRVLASNQRITGYSGGNGIPTKEWLLAHESIAYK